MKLRETISWLMGTLQRGLFPYLQFRQWRAVFKGDRDRRREVFLFVYSGEKVRVSWREFLLGERG